MRPPKRLLSSAPASTGGNTTTATHGTGTGTDTGPGNTTAADRARNQWGPFRNAATYGADMALALGILLSAFVLGLLLMIGVRFYLRRRRGANPVPPAGEPEKPARGGADAGDESAPEPPTVYTAGETELAGEAECAICLTEFADGDGLRVLPSCRHGFHVECVETWVASFVSSEPSSRRAAPSCPVCRASCRPPARSPQADP